MTSPTQPPKPKIESLANTERGFALKDTELVEDIYGILTIENMIRWDRYNISSALAWFDLHKFEPLTSELTTSPVLSALRVVRRKPTDAEGDFIDHRIANFYERHFNGPDGKIGVAVVPSASNPEALAELYIKLKTHCEEQRVMGDYIDAGLRRAITDLPETDYYRISTSGTSGWKFSHSDDNRLLTIDYRTYP